MRIGIVQLFTLFSVAALLGGCEGEQPLAPTTERSFKASNLGVPSNLKATATAVGRIRLTWQDNSTNESGFEVLRSLTDIAGSLAGYTATSAGIVTYEDSGVEPSSRYCYAVRSFKTAGRTTSYSAISSTACTTTPVPPGAPAGPTAVTAISLNSSTVSVTWADNSGNETGFRVERGPTVSGPWQASGATDAGLTSLSDGARASEAQVCYRVAAFNSNGQSMWSGQTACAIPPAGPTNLQPGGKDQGTIDLTWTDNSAFEDGYQIQRATTQEGPYSVIAEIAADVTAYRDAGLASDQLYWYRLRARRAGGFSDFSTPTAGILATSLPAAPTWVSASPFNGWSTFVIWTDNSTNEVGFRLERSDGGGPWVTIMALGPGVVATRVGVWDSTHYPEELEICYRVVAFNSVGESSDTGCTALPAIPTNLTATVVDRAVELSWTDNSRFEDGFYIVRADGSSMGFYYVYDAVGANVTTFRDPNPSPEWSSYYLRAAKGPEGYTCCSNAVDVFMPPAPE